MNGLTPRLLGRQPAVLVANTNLSGTGVRDKNVSLRNVIIDGRTG